MGTFTNKNEVIIKIDGKTYEDYNFLNITLSQKLLKPNELRFTMQKKNWKKSVNDSNFPTPKELMGAKVFFQFQTSYFDNRDQTKEASQYLRFDGIIFDVDVYSGSFSEQLIAVTALTSDYLLMDHPHCYSYQDKTLTEIVKETLEPYDIPNKIQPDCGDCIPYTVQYNETNYQFLTRLAKRYGEWMYNDGVKWIFGRAPRDKTINLEARNDVTSYYFKSRITHHTLKYAHHDYLDYQNFMVSDKDIPGLSNPGYHVLTDEAFKKSEKLFKKETFHHLHCGNPERELGEPGMAADVQLRGEKSLQVLCSGSSVRSDLKIGSSIMIYDSFYQGDKLSYINYEPLMIIEIIHYAEIEGHYSNRFTAVSDSCTRPPYYQSDVFPLSLPQQAKVIDNKDPEHMGRIKVQFIWQEEQDKDLTTPWIRIAQPHGGNDKGFYFIPEINEEVMVNFVNGNAEKPFVVGTLFHGLQRPGVAWPKDSNDIKAIRTRNGHTIEIHDEEKDGYIQIYDYKKNNYVLTFSTDDKLIRLSAKGNIELNAGHDIRMKAGHNIVMDADNDILETAHNEMTLESVGKQKILTYSEQLVEAHGKHETVSKGSFVEIASESDTVIINGSVKALVKAPDTVINGYTMVSVIGDIVKIN